MISSKAGSVFPPVFRLKQIFVWTEENSPVTVDTGDPDREVGSLVTRTHVQLRRLLLILLPH